MEYRLSAEIRLMHEDGWHLYVADKGSDGIELEIGYREWVEDSDGSSGWVSVGKSISVPLEMAGDLAKVLTRFQDKES